MEKVAKIKDIKDKLCASVNGKSLALFNIKGKIYCIEGKCSHMEGPLCEGKVNGSIVTCPWHGSKFDVKNGALKGPPAMKGVKSYKVVVKGEDVFVDM